MRVLVTGSRTCKRDQLVWWALDVTLDLTTRSGGKLTVVHGDAPDGADAIAAAWVARRLQAGAPVTPEPHPAEWGVCTPECRHPEKRRKGEVYCPLAGFRRNGEMVDAGADYCLAFVERCPCPDERRNKATGMHGTHGAVDCAVRAVAAGIPVRHFIGPGTP